MPDRIFRYVDGLRGIAVLAVFLAYSAFHSSRFTGSTMHSLLEGNRGADLFFALLGFCLAYPALRKWSAAVFSACYALGPTAGRRRAGIPAYDEWPPLPPLPNPLAIEDGASGLARRAP